MRVASSIELWVLDRRTYEHLIYTHLSTKWVLDWYMGTWSIQMRVASSTYMWVLDQITFEYLINTIRVASLIELWVLDEVHEYLICTHLSTWLIDVSTWLIHQYLIDAYESCFINRIVSTWSTYIWAFDLYTFEY